MKTKALVIMSTVVFIALVAVGCGVKKPVMPQAPSQPTVVPPTQEPSPTTQKEKTPVEIYFDNTKAVEATGTKSKAVDATLQPILKKIFDTEVNGEKVVGVKLREDFGGSMLTYATNRTVTEADMTAVKTELEKLGFKTIESSGNGMTVQSPDNKMWVVTFFLNNIQKGGLELTF